MFRFVGVVTQQHPEMEGIGGLDDIIVKEVSVSFPPPDVVPFHFIGKIESHRIVIRDVSFLLPESNSIQLFF
ncbi:hypothetical protein D9M71_782290 [compost metagenome]